MLCYCYVPTGLFVVWYPVFYQHFIRQLSDNPVRDIMWVDINLTPSVTKSRRNGILNLPINSENESKSQLKVLQDIYQNLVPLLLIGEGVRG